MDCMCEIMVMYMRMHFAHDDRILSDCARIHTQSTQATSWAGKSGTYAIAMLRLDLWLHVWSRRWTSFSGVPYTSLM